MLTEAEPELQVVVDCARTAIVTDAAPDPPPIDDAPDWDRVVALARYHGVVQLLYEGLEAMARESGDEFTVPAAVLTRLSSIVQGKRMRNLAFTTELQEILERFETRGVRAVPFKGPALSVAAYDDATVREYNDLDLLVHPEDIPAAADILEERGYEWRGGTPRLDDAALLGGPVTKAIVHEYEMRGPEFDVELRWRVGDAERPFSTSFGELWDRRDTVSVGGQPLPALAQPDRLLVLAFHGTKHRWYLLKWLCDFVAALEAAETDWPHVLVRARETGVERNLLLGAALARAVFGYALPAPLLDRLRSDGRVSELAEAVVESLAAGTPQAPTQFEAARFYLAASDSMTALVPLLLLHSSLHPTYSEYQFCPLPGPMHPLYYVIWPLRLLLETPQWRRQLSEERRDEAT
ncbi:putative nucleotidyltransferase-like protein [Haloarcula quadrata]|uniref:Putative nucleotidyltransferase-like protein n=1 Tax=Haloarcula quadrata TaxID=182779 RepID=A0A495R665_9EURY|nr:nucleotidyltransferase family protein [Haloarcula quadrata]RKS82368.1 putative nucleotidyltransferase-like protein [Haloarcula quadrata]